MDGNDEIDYFELSAVIECDDILELAALGTPSPAEPNDLAAEPKDLACCSLLSALAAPISCFRKCFSDWISHFIAKNVFVFDIS